LPRDAGPYTIGGRFAEPDPYGGSYNLSDPQSLNRYAYTKNDPVNRRDPSGLDATSPTTLIGQINRPVVNAPAPYTVTVTAGPEPISGGSLIGGLLGNDAMAILESAPAGIEPEPQNSVVGTPQDLRNSIYSDKALLANINSCLREKLGKNFNKIGEQTLANAPRIDGRLTSEQLSAKYTGGASTYAVGVADVGKYGTVFIGSQWFSNPTDWTVNGRGSSPGRTPLQNSYVHELGNIISQRLTGGDSRLFAVKGSTDEDSGYALQACVFNEQVQMKKP
jgi:hypothetical protein